jgi:hypothetical protein
MSEDEITTPAGMPSRIATRAGPWDSPAVSQRSMASVFHAPPYHLLTVSPHTTPISAPASMNGPNA